jgi:hypothetical protein
MEEQYLLLKHLLLVLEGLDIKTLGKIDKRVKMLNDAYGKDRCCETEELTDLEYQYERRIREVHNELVKEVLNKIRSLKY